MTGIIAHPSVLKDLVIGTCQSIFIVAVVFAFPLFGVFALLLLPLPVLYYRLKLGRNSGMIIIGASFAVLLMMSQGVAFDVLYLMGLMITGFLLGECIERQLGIERTMLYTAVGVIGAALAAFLIYITLRGHSLGELVSQYVAQYFKLTGSLYADMGMDDRQIAVLNSAFLIVMPGMFIVSYLSTVWLNILIIKKLLLRIGIELKNIGNLTHYRAPSKLVWAVIALGVLLMLPVEAVKYFSINCLIVLMLVYFFQGIAIVSFFFQKKGSPVLLRVLCYALIGIQLYFLILVVGLGFFDNWINFRKLGAQK